MKTIGPHRPPIVFVLIIGYTANKACTAFLYFRETGNCFPAQHTLSFPLKEIIVLFTKNARWIRIKLSSNMKTTNLALFTYLRNENRKGVPLIGNPFSI